MGGRAVDETRQPRGVVRRSQAMPLTQFQRALLATLAATPTDDRYLAGGAAMHFAPNSTRYSDDLDFFHDSEVRACRATQAEGLPVPADREVERAGALEPP